VISLADNKLLKLGRGHESDVRIADVSISRCHATIRFLRGQFVLEDHNSKFGTLIAMKKPRALEVSSSISIQVGRTVLSLTLQHNNQPCAEGGLELPPRLGQQRSPSNAQEERALRISLLTRGSVASTEDEESVRRASTTATIGSNNGRPTGGDATPNSTGDGQHHITF